LFTHSSSKKQKFFVSFFQKRNTFFPKGQEKMSISSAPFWAMAVASALHAMEEYAYPGGFLPWLRQVFPRSAPGVAGAVVINTAFFALVLSPLVSDPRATPIFSLSIAALLLANGSLHVIGTFLSHRYAPGAVTSALCYFPAAFYTLFTIPGQWNMPAAAVWSAIWLGLFWQAIPLGVMIVRR
jgi:hypothetical protein